MREGFPSSPGTGPSVGDWPIGVIEVGCDGRIHASNRAAAELLAPFGGAPWRDFPGWLSAYCPVAPPCASRRGSARHHSAVSAGGTRIGVTMMDHGDGFTALLRDETDLARAEAEAHRHRASFSALADSLKGAAAFTLDREGRVSGWSRSAEDAEGLSAAQAMGLPFHLLLARSRLSVDAGPMLAEAAANGAAAATVVRLDPQRGLRRISVDLRAVQTGDGGHDGFVVTLREHEGSTASEAELRRLADTDPLTGVLNRRAFTDVASVACALGRDQGLAFGVIVFDLDSFKLLNDQHGHAAGDAALQAMADAARRDVRAGDLIGRLGGDEFAIALPRADAALAERIAERLRRTFAALRLRHRDRTLRFTASFGVAASADPLKSYAETLAEADAALYRAKHAGRDRIAAA